jgi:hypothetical protein
MRLFQASTLRPWPRLLFSLLALWMCGGCKTCLDCDDDVYAAYGGAWQRTNPHSGRVGSVFSEAGARVADYQESIIEPESVPLSPTESESLPPQADDGADDSAADDPPPELLGT